MALRRLTILYGPTISHRHGVGKFSICKEEKTLHPVPCDAFVYPNSSVNVALPGYTPLTTSSLSFRPAKVISAVAQTSLRAFILSRPSRFSLLSSLGSKAIQGVTSCDTFDKRSFLLSNPNTLYIKSPSMCRSRELHPLKVEIYARIWTSGRELNTGIHPGRAFGRLLERYGAHRIHCDKVSIAAAVFWEKLWASSLLLTSSGTVSCSASGRKS